MRLAIVNHSSDPAVTGSILAEIADACEQQAYQHLADLWQSAGVPIRHVGSISELETGESPIVVFDDADQAGALGYHDVTPEGLPYARVFWKPIQASGGGLTKGTNSLSVTVSHEAVEAICDPYASFWAQTPEPGVLEALESADRVEGDSYEIDGVAVSNFLGPRAFRVGPGPYDWMRLLKDSWELRPGGYAIRWRVGTGDVYDVWGKDVPEHKKLSKAHPAARTARRRRVGDQVSA